MPFSLASGSGVIFGTTGGVTEAVVMRLLKDKPDHTEKQVIFNEVRGLDNIKEASFNVDGREVRVAIVHGLKNADNLIKMIKAGEKHYDFIEVMACPGGCVSGGGQPAPIDSEIRAKRASGLYRIDRKSFIKSSELNPLVTELFEDFLKDKKEILHVHKNSEVSYGQ